MSAKKRDLELLEKKLEDKNESYIYKLEEENRNLKRENEKLRKQVNTINFVETNQKYLEYCEFVEIQKEDAAHEKSMKDKWLCHDCGRDVLYINIFSFNNQKKYYRACPSCNKRTKLKNFTESVKGLFKKEKQGQGIA